MSHLLREKYDPPSHLTPLIEGPIILIELTKVSISDTEAPRAMNMLLAGSTKVSATLYWYQLGPLSTLSSTAFSDPIVQYSRRHFYVWKRRNASISYSAEAAAKMELLMN